MAKIDKIKSFAVKALSDQINRNKMIAIVEKNGNILSIGTNNMTKSHSCYFNGEFDKAVHAEYSAINKLSEPEGSNIYVFRFLKNGGMGLSKPCNHCMDLIIKNKIRTITYFDGKNIITERVRNNAA